jgi:hypothetical protein
MLSGMRAQQIIERLQADGWVEVARMVADEEPESLHLDFKCLEGLPGAPLSDKDLARVAKAASAFANVEGGVLILGIKTKEKGKGEPDRADSLAFVPNVQAAAGQLDRRVAALTDPPVPGLRVIPIQDPAHATRGILALYVPPSDGGPHQAGFGDVGSRYYIRTSTNSTPAPHSILVGMFGRHPQPSLRLGLSLSPAGEGSLFLINTGRGVADDVLVRASLHAGGTGTNLFAVNVTHGHGWEPRVGRPMYIRALNLSLTTFSKGPHYPADASRILTFGNNVHPTDPVKVSARIDSRHAMPVFVEATITFDGANLVTVPALSEEVVGQRGLLAP